MAPWPLLYGWLLAVGVYGQAPAVTTQSGSVVGVLSGLASVSQFAQLLNASQAQSFGMKDVFGNLTLAKGARTAPPLYTILAFTNDAVAALSAGPSAGLLATPGNTAALLTFHLVPNAIIDFATPGSLQPFVQTYLTRYGNGFDNLGNGIPQSIGIKGNSFTTGAVTANVVQSIRTDYGMIHVINAVLVIPSDIISMALQQKWNDWGLWATAANITSSIKTLQGITILVPQQGGIASFLTAGGVTGDVTNAFKTAALEYHIINGIFYSNQIASTIGKGSWGPNTAQQTYFNGQNIYAVDRTHFSASNSSSAPRITIITSDILFDSGVIHIVDTLLLPPTVTGSLASAAPSVSPLTQLNMDDGGDLPVGTDFPVASVVGGSVAGLAVIGIAVALYFVIKRRRLIALLEMERARRVKELEAINAQYEDQYEEDSPEYVEEGTDSVTLMVTHPTVVKKGDHRVPLKGDEEESGDDSGDEEDEDEEAAVGTQSGIRRAQDEILQFRRAQWAADDTSSGNKKASSDNKRASTASSGKKSDKRVSIIDTIPLSPSESRQVTKQQSSGALTTTSSGGGGEGKSLLSPSSAKRSSAAYSKRMSTASTNSALESIVIADPKEAKKEAVRNSWWSNTGVGAGASYENGVLEAQALREEQRRSWWSGSAEVQEQLAVIESQSRRGSFAEKRRSMASSVGWEGGRRRSSNTMLSVYQVALGTGAAAKESQDQETELEYVDPRKAVSTRRSTGHSLGAAKTYRPSKASALGEGVAVGVDGKTKRTSANVATEYAIAEEEESALAFVVGNVNK
ncbi:hypothetical protein BC830DRAFT_1229310 [Chytriomyces sp. MP71]|nr:hypothetical protein BC830DRAFT_1229310 [Chytriomyces sp. MP71]